MEGPAFACSYYYADRSYGDWERSYSIAQIVLVGNSAAVIIPKPLLEEVGLDVGDRILIRTTLGVTYEFLKQNGYSLEVSMQELIDFPLKVENKHLSLEEIKKWLEKHTKRKTSSL